MSHPLRLDAERWTTNAEMLARAQGAGEQLDQLVADALQSRDATQLTEAVRALDRGEVAWFRVNMPASAGASWYDAHRRALTARAVAVFGPVEGPRIAKPLEYTPIHPR
jgi:hypothetical protein